MSELHPDLRTRDQQATCAYCEAVVHALIGVYPELKMAQQILAGMPGGTPKPPEEPN